MLWGGPTQSRVEGVLNPGLARSQLSFLPFPYAQLLLLLLQLLHEGCVAPSGCDTELAGDKHPILDTSCNRHDIWAMLQCCWCCCPACVQVRSYIFELEKHLGEAHRQAGRLVRHQAELGSAVQEFGTAMTTLGRFEESVSPHCNPCNGSASPHCNPCNGFVSPCDNTCNGFVSPHDNICVGFVFVVPRPAYLLAPCACRSALTGCKLSLLSGWLSGWLAC